MGCDKAVNAPVSLTCVFQSTHPSGVRRRRCRCWRSWCHFNPRTPVGCDSCPRVWWRTRPISIHAPQWGATDVSQLAEFLESISIHAPQWGATSMVTVRPSRRRYFNPRTPVGCDPFLASHVIDGEISIHAPQWGATGHVRLVERPADLISIHAPQWGATNHAIPQHATIGFQSTHPSGVRPAETAQNNKSNLFQSTHPSGVRLNHAIPQHATIGFQSTHPSGVRPEPHRDPRARHDFNPRTPVGCDRENGHSIP